MFLCLIFLPLLGFLSAIIFGRFIGKNGAAFITNICIFISFILSIFLFYYVGILGNTYITNLGIWAHIGMYTIKWAFLFDRVTVTMAFVVLSVSFCVHCYSTSYMSEDPHIIRFLSYLSLFTFFMLILISGENLILLFLGWEGVGLCSYLLINFWFTRLQANKSAIKAFIVNKIGDFSLLIALGFIYLTYNSFDFSVIFALTPYVFNNNFTFNFFFYEVSSIDCICLLLFLAAVGKSAQIGLHVWLPDAMEGPTPVSALIHAATMVTAGVFLIIRCSPLFEFSPNILFIITIFGALTAFISATIGLFQNDIKKVIAYSTCSQLGYMVFSCGTSNYHLALYHLVNHAFFKALLFLCAGAIIHTLRNEQDMRKMGGLSKILPLTYVMVLIGSLSLTGFPFLSGFYSKEFILSAVFINSSQASLFAYWLGTFSAFFTTLYSFRLFYLVFFVKTNLYKSHTNVIHEMPLIMGVPLSFLAFLSIFSGYLLKDIFIGFGSNFFYHDIFIQNLNYNFIESEFLPFYIKLIPFIFTIFGFSFGLFIFHFFFSFYIKHYFNNSFFYSLFKFYNSHWYFNNIYNNFIVLKTFKLGYQIFILFDKGILEIYGPYGITYYLYSISFKINRLHNMFIYYYSYYFLFFICIFFGFFNI